jgi:uncharacterized protein
LFTGKFGNTPSIIDWGTIIEKTMALEMINWIEIPVIDMARAKAFYENVFEFKIVEMEVAGEIYHCFPDRSGKGFCGALVQYDFTRPGNAGPLVYFESGRSMDAMIRRIVVAGGKILQAKQEIAPGFGYSAIFKDSEGNMLALQGDTWHAI